MNIEYKYCSPFLCSLFYFENLRTIIVINNIMGFHLRNYFKLWKYKSSQVLNTYRAKYLNKTAV